MNNVGVTLTVDNAALKKSFDEDIKLLSDMTRNVDQFNKTAVSGARQAIQAQMEYGKELGVSLDQMRSLNSVSDQLEKKVSAAGDRMATAAERGARGLSVMARQGTVTARSINQIIAAGADIAFAFGPEGTIISAVLMVTAGIVSHFENAESKMEEAVAKFNHSLDEMLLNDSPIELAKDRARAYVEELEAQAAVVAPALRSAEARVMGAAFGGGMGSLMSSFFGGGEKEAVKNAGAKVAGIDAASALLAPVHTHDKEIDRLKKEEDQANSEVTTWRERVDALKANGKAAELKVAQHELTHVQSEKNSLIERIHGLEQERINTAQAIADKMNPADPMQYSLLNPIKDRGLTDFSEQDQHSDAAVSSKRASDKIAAMGKSNAEQHRLLSEHVADVARANEMLSQMDDTARERQLRADGDAEGADKERAVREFDRKADEINKLVNADEALIGQLNITEAEKTRMLLAAEEERTRLLVAATQDRNTAIADVEHTAAAKLDAQILRDAEAGKREVDRLNAEQLRATEKLGAQLGQVGGKMADDLVKGKEDLGRRLLKAAMEPEIAMLQGWAKSQFTQAAKDFAIQDYVGAAEHMLGGTLLMAGAAELGSLAGGGGGSGGGSSGGGGGGGSAATHLGASGGQSNGPLMIHVVVVHEDQNGREISRTAQKLQRLDDRNVPIRVGAVG